MIKINLNYLESAKQSSFLGGVSKSVKKSPLNIPILLLCSILGFGPILILEDKWKTENENLEEEINSFRKESGKLKGSKRGMEKEISKLNDLQQKEQSFAKKSKIVKAVFDKKNNPTKLLKYVAENIPKDVWILEIDLKEKGIKINGYALNYLSINKFIKNLNESVFFNKKVKLESYDTKTLKGSGRRVEKFYIKSEVVQF